MALTISTTFEYDKFFTLSGVQWHVQLASVVVSFVMTVLLIDMHYTHTCRMIHVEINTIRHS